MVLTMGYCSGSANCNYGMLYLQSMWQRMGWWYEAMTCIHEMQHFQSLEGPHEAPPQPMKYRHKMHHREWRWQMMGYCSGAVNYNTWMHHTNRSDRGWDDDMKQWPAVHECIYSNRPKAHTKLHFYHRSTGIECSNTNGSDRQWDIAAAQRTAILECTITNFNWIKSLMKVNLH